MDKQERYKKDADWSKAIVNRDKKCLSCNKTNNLTPAHILRRVYRKMRWNLKNGITLCMFCHNKFDNNKEYREKLLKKLKIDEEKLKKELENE